jgi:ferredoxin/coenzyme F420-reducing hydrogenase delta subunit
MHAMRWFKEQQRENRPVRVESCDAEDNLLRLESPEDRESWAQIAQPVPQHPLSRAVTAVLLPLDRCFDRLYGSRLNPLYQSGALAIFLFTVVIVTGVYLLFFYKVSAPYESVTRLHQQLFTGRWIRALHRYASDAAMIAILFHVLRMLAHGRTWGPRVVAWISGAILTGVMLLSGWTGQVMVWDAQAQLIAIEGGKLFDLLPIFSEPVSRAFVSNDSLPQSFFFLNLFLHVALPLGAAVALWIHVARVARPRLFPPKALAGGLLVALVLFAIVWPPYMLAKADLLRIPTTFAIDWFFCFWLPIARQFAAGGHVLFWLLLSAGLLSVPWWLRPRCQNRPAPSRDNFDLCQGCDQCWQDCPFEAIRMIPRPQPRERASERVAMVDTHLCVSCGLCAGSCAPMAIGPPNRTGRVQLRTARAWFTDQPITGGQVVVLVCGYNELSRDAQLGQRDDIVLLPTSCSGSLHTSVLEQLLRLGASGVCIVSCPSRNCVQREGPKWLFERVYNDREAELPRRVDRRRICLINGASGERRQVLQALNAFCDRLAGEEARRDYEGSELPRHEPRPSVLTHVRMFLPRMAVTVLFLALLAAGNRTPVGHAGTDGVLRLAWRLPGEKIETCRTLSAEELASKPVHMRQPRECTVQPLSYRLALTIDGEKRLDQTIAPAGARGDRPLYVLEDLRLDAGTHPIAVAFTPILPVSVPQDSEGSARLRQHPHLALHTRVTIDPDQITLIDYDPQAEAFVVVDRQQ